MRPHSQHLCLQTRGGEQRGLVCAPSESSPWPFQKFVVEALGFWNPRTMESWTPLKAMAAAACCAVVQPLILEHLVQRKGSGLKTCAAWQLPFFTRIPGWPLKAPPTSGLGMEAGFCLPGNCRFLYLVKEGQRRVKSRWGVFSFLAIQRHL